MSTAERTNPELWETVKAEITRSDKGGSKGEWSARKAQLAVQEYKKRGGGYKGKKTPDNHLRQWTEEDWGTKSGRASKATGERYLPRKARETLSDEDYKRTTAKKRADTRKGRQFSAQPPDVAKKTAPFRRDDGAGADGSSGGERVKRSQAAGGARAKQDRASETAPESRGRETPKNGGGPTANGTGREPTKKELAEAAMSLGVGQISSKNKSDLATAIRAAVRGEAGGRMTKADLQELARTLAVDLRSSMTKSELQSAIAPADDRAARDREPFTSRMTGAS